jgi:hypothetical protein
MEKIFNGLYGFQNGVFADNVGKYILILSVFWEKRSRIGCCGSSFGSSPHGRRSADGAGGFPTFVPQVYREFGDLVHKRVAYQRIELSAR